MTPRKGQYTMKTYYSHRRPLSVSRSFSFMMLVYLAAITLAIPVAYKSGQLNPTEKVAAAIKAQAYDAGRQSVIDEPPNAKELDLHCSAWLMESNLLATRKRICGK